MKFIAIFASLFAFALSASIPEPLGDCHCEPTCLEAEFCGDYFVAKVIVTGEFERNGYPDTIGWHDIHVQKVYKGNYLAKKSLETGQLWMSIGECGVKLRNGTTYVVSGYPDGYGHPQIYRCSLHQSFDLLTGAEKELLNTEAFEKIDCNKRNLCG